MGIQYLSALNMNQNPIYGLVLQSLPNAPETPVEGQIYFDTVDNQPFCYVEHDNGGSWVSMTDANTGDLDTRVEALERILTGVDDEESDVTINRLSEVLTFLNGVSDDQTLMSSFIAAEKKGSYYNVNDSITFHETIEGYASTADDVAAWEISNDGTAYFKSLLVGDKSVLTSGNTSFTSSLSEGVNIGTLTINNKPYTLYAPVSTGNIDLTGYAKRHVGSIKGDGITTTFTVTHNLGACVAQVLDSDMHVVYVDTQHRSSTSVTGAYDAVFNFATAPAAGTNYSVILVG